MKINQNISLTSFNTFGIDVSAIAFTEVSCFEHLTHVLRKNKKQHLILGGGSNILFTQNFDGLVIKNNFRGIAILEENDQNILIKVGAGEVWHDFVLFCIQHNYAGIENLSLIPGSVGACPIQNIGAYGVEVKDVITEVEVFDLYKHVTRTFSNLECEFDYRSSIFKTSEKGRHCVTSVTFRLKKQATIHTAYGDIEQELERLKILSPSIQDVSRAVINIRSSKLPDPKKLGNSGSFFKNPIISEAQKNIMLQNHTDMPHYPQPNGSYKIAAGWLIEQCGWKGKRIENYGVHEHQSLVLVNHGGAQGRDIFNLSEKIIESVYDTFEIKLEREVNVL
jgi:UDP-N-acetylmuramate dehydrogenase